MPNIKTVEIIGCGDADKAAIEAILQSKGMNDVILVTAGEQLSDEIVPELPRGVTFRLEAPPLIEERIYSDYKDGRTLRRERRKRERKR